MSRLHPNRYKQHIHKVTVTSTTNTKANIILDTPSRRHRHTTCVAISVTVPIFVMAYQDTGVWGSVVVKALRY
jgi:hypothetical protein